MRALVINMAQATERMDMMVRQLDRLGIEWQRIEAVTPETLEPGPDDPLWSRWQRPLRVTEMALFASHRKAWGLVGDQPVLILEDDALLSERFGDVLQDIGSRNDIDHLSLETRGRKKLLERAPGAVWPMRQDRTGAAAYVLWPSGARALLERANDIAAIADAQIAETRMNSFQAVPAMALQCDMCGAYGITPPIATQSFIDKVDKPPVPKGQGFRRRRIFGQLAMGLTALSHSKASRVHVQPDAGIAEMAAWLASTTK